MPSKALIDKFNAEAAKNPRWRDFLKLPTVKAAGGVDSPSAEELEAAVSDPALHGVPPASGSDEEINQWLGGPNDTGVPPDSARSEFYREKGREERLREAFEREALEAAKPSNPVDADPEHYQAIPDEQSYSQKAFSDVGGNPDGFDLLDWGKNLLGLQEQPSPVDQAMPDVAGMTPRDQAPATNDVRNLMVPTTEEAGFKVKGAMPVGGAGPSYSEQLQGQDWYAQAEKAAAAAVATAKAKSEALLESDRELDENLRMIANERQEYLRQSAARSQMFEQMILNSEIDPNRYMGSKTTGQQFMISIGLVLSGMGAGMTGQPNAALELLNKNIDRDIESQRSKLGKLQTLYSMHLGRVRDSEQAYQQTKLDMLSIAKGQLQMVADQFGGEDEQNKKNALLATLSQEQLKIANELATGRADRAVKYAQARHLNQQTAMLPFEMQAKFKKGQQEGAVHIPIYDQAGQLKNMHQVFVADTVLRNDLHKKSINFMNMMTGLNELREFNKKHERGSLMPADIQRATTIVNTFITTFPRGAEDVTRMPNQADMVKLQEAIANPSSIWKANTGQVAASIDALDYFLRSRFNNELMAAGVIGVPGAGAH